MGEIVRITKGNQVVLDNAVSSFISGAGAAGALARPLMALTAATSMHHRINNRLRAELEKQRLHYEIARADRILQYQAQLVELKVFYEKHRGDMRRQDVNQDALIGQIRTITKLMNNPRTPGHIIIHLSRLLPALNQKLVDFDWQARQETVTLAQILHFAPLDMTLAKPRTKRL